VENEARALCSDEKRDVARDSVTEKPSRALWKLAGHEGRPKADVDNVEHERNVNTDGKLPGNEKSDENRIRRNVQAPNQMPIAVPVANSVFFIARQRFVIEWTYGIERKLRPIQLALRTNKITVEIVRHKSFPCDH
jgi:hypothetical protein